MNTYFLEVALHSGIPAPVMESLTIVWKTLNRSDISASCHICVWVLSMSRGESCSTSIAVIVSVLRVFGAHAALRISAGPRCVSAVSVVHAG